MINLDKNSYKEEAKIKTRIRGFVLPVFLLLLIGCESKRVIYTPRGYDITKPEVTELGTKLKEISGIFWINDTVILANNDESGKIFSFDPTNKKDFEYRSVRFGEKNDYEDIVKVDSFIYLLISPGQIVKVSNYKNEDSIQSEVVASLEGKNEFETIYYDKEVNSIIMLCKSCHKEKDQVRQAFRFDLATNSLIDTPYYAIDINSIRKKLDDSRAEFRPSAAAVNPADNKLYIVSSIGKLLVVADRKGKVEQTIPISGTLFPQPEGITFASNGDMYISNEAANDDRATLLKFSFKKK